MLKCLEPNYSFMLLLQITPSWLRNKGYRAIILDVDNTYMRRDRFATTDLHRDWLNKVLLAGIRVVFVSNNGGSRLKDLAAATGLPVVEWAGKPLPLAFFRACRSLQMPKQEILVIGDQLFTDVLGANLYGLDVALVKPLDGAEFIVTTWMRSLERQVLPEDKKTTATGCTTGKEE